MRVIRIRDTFTLFFADTRAAFGETASSGGTDVQHHHRPVEPLGSAVSSGPSRSQGCYLRGAVAVCGTRQREGADAGQLRFLPAKPAAPVRLKTLQPGEVRAFGNRPPMVVELALRRAVERAMTAVRKRGV